MENKTIVTYSLLTHLKETKFSNHSSIAEIFFPIVKKAIVEYSKERGNIDVKGRNISEIQIKIIEFFGIDIPLGVLDFILLQIQKEISDDNTFAYYQDKSFIINTYAFNDIDDDIHHETQNIDLLKVDFENFCKTLRVTPNFDELVKFVCSQKMELFSEKCDDDLDFEYYIPKYIGLKFSDEKIFKIISDVYLGSIISSYFTFKINSPVTNTELLIDTNFFISLIDLNTPESFQTCNQLHEICERLGYRFTILFSTIEQIKYLLNSRIQDFSNKDIGLIKDADVFGACIRRGLDKTQLERIKDNIDSQLRKYNISIIHEVQIKDIIEKAKRSDKYKEILEIRHNHKLSALNDTIAFFYVNKKRGTNITEFADVKCWFLNNTFHADYFSSIGYKLHERYKISANELLSLLWLANPNQEKIDLNVLSKGGLSTYIAKYKQYKVPSTRTIKEINNRTKKALQEGDLLEKDVFAISIRMAEGQLTNGEATKLSELPDEEFIKAVKEQAKKDEEILSKIDTQSEIIKNQNVLLERMERQNLDTQYSVEIERYERKKERYVESKLPNKIIEMNKIAWGYIVFVIIISTLWFVNYLELKLIGVGLSGAISFLLFLAALFIRFVEHKNVLKCLKFTFIRNYRLIIIEELRGLFENEYTKENKEPVRLIYEKQ